MSKMEGGGEGGRDHLLKKTISQYFWDGCSMGKKRLQCSSEFFRFEM